MLEEVKKYLAITWNDEITNFVPLCPTHHQYYHSRFRYLVKDKIDEYQKQINQHKEEYKDLKNKMEKLKNIKPENGK